MNKAKKALTIVVSVILWIVILLAALFAFTTLATKDATRPANVAGFTPMSVQTDSMKPTFNAGDLIIVRRCDTDALQVGDIVTFHTIIGNDYALNTHRIKEITEENGVRNFVTMGDNNVGEDIRRITSSDIVGKYSFRIPKMGKVIDFLSKPLGFLLIIVLPMVAFFIYQVYHLIVVGIKLKKAVAAENAEAANTDAQNARAEAEKAKREAEEALAEAKRLKEEAERLKAEAGNKPE